VPWARCCSSASTTLALSRVGKTSTRSDQDPLVGEAIRRDVAMEAIESIVVASPQQWARVSTIASEMDG